MKSNNFDYDKTFKPGDIITAYSKGYHRFLRYEKRKNCNPLVIYETLLDGKCNKFKKSSVKQCDAYWCKKVTMEIIDKAFSEQRRNLEELFNGVEEYRTHYENSKESLK